MLKKSSPIYKTLQIHQTATKKIFTCFFLKEKDSKDFMFVKSIGKKLMPTVFALSAITGIANATNTKNDEKLEAKIVTVNTPAKTTPLSFGNIIMYTAIGAFGGAALATAFNTIKNRRNISPQDKYFDKNFAKESEKVSNYMYELISEAMEDRPYYVNMNEFLRNTGKFCKKYPSRLEPLFMAIKTFYDERLDDAQAELLAGYLVLRATCTAEEWKTANLFPFLDKYDNDYNGMVEELLLRVNAVEVHERESEDADAETNAVNYNSETKQNTKEENVQKTFHSNVTFKDVGGQNDAIRALKRSILYPIKYPKAFENNSMKHGFVLYGAPGTGKTLIAEALANESMAHFIKLNGNELSSKWVGESEENWRKIFDEARKYQPSIIFIDEFDAVASKRGQGDTHGDKVLNQILGLLSDIEKNKDRVYFIATTNRLDKIDEALIRSGRFGTKIELKTPQNSEEVKQILTIHLKKYKTDDKLDIDSLSKKLFDIKANGADIAYIVNESYENAMNRNKIYEKMDDNTFVDDDINSMRINNSDIENAISNFKNNTKDSRPIGFNLNK